jgi:uncharacterized MAPEG superfamily protein
MISVPLTMLLWSSILMFVLILVPAAVAIHRNGPKAQGGARDGLPEPSAFMKRAERLNANMRENMILFTALVVVAQFSGSESANIALGAEVFFYARLVHAVIYLAGWPWVRPVAWTVSLVGMGMMAAALMA